MIRWEIHNYEELEKESIDMLEGANTAVNVCKRNGIWTLGDLCDRWNTLKDIKGLGITKRAQLKAAMFDYCMEREGRQKGLWN